MSLQNTAEWLTNQAVANHKQGQLEKAIAYYLELIELDDNQPAWVYGNVITLIARVDGFDEASELEKKAIALHPESDEVYRALGILYEKQVDDLNCIEPYQKAILLEPQQPDWLYCNLAKQLLQNKRAEEAAEIAQKGTQLYPNFHPLYYVLGNALVKLERWSQAIASYQKVQQLNPDWEEVRQKLIQTIYRKSQAERLIQHQPDRPETTAPAVFGESNTATPDPEPVSSSNIDRSTIDKWTLDDYFALGQDGQLSSSDCERIWQDFAGVEVGLAYGCWLSPSILYLEATANDNFVFDEVQILACSDTKYGWARANLWQISQEQVIGIACFERNIDPKDYERFRLCINSNSCPIFIAPEVYHKAHSLEFIEYLHNQSDRQKQIVREYLSSAIIELIPNPHKPQAKDVLKKLQYFLEIPAQNYVDPNLPFQIFIDYIIPLESEGLFISGWLHDPYEMLETITVVSGLGFSLKLSQPDIHYLERHDVSQFLQDTRFGEFGDERLGFCAYVPVPKGIQRSLQGLAELHSFRFIINLQGNIEIEITPDAKYSDCYQARQRIMQIVRPDRVDEAMLLDCIVPTALKLQQLCIKRVAIKNITDIGSPVQQPLVSIIIPLYRRLDFIQVQLATMVNDPDIKQCEIIYVLDSPEQEEEVKAILLERCTLYELPVKLVVMKHNSGYGAANNAGASQATGQYLILLNSDVFAKTKGWITKMAQFYASQPQVGVLGAKLLYEDNSLQHAGMFFAQTTFPFWLTLHYYKGLPGNYAPAQKTRPVPAVTGACLMIARKLYEEVGGLTTDYVIGDFEDSDLCFKCRALGYESWYFAEATLYHLERQSVPLNNAHNGSLAWQLNGRLHHERWQETISELMSIYR